MNPDFRGYIIDAIVCKRPLIEFDSSGNPKEGDVEDRLEAVTLEIQVLTHPPFYLHKNIVDFLGICWQTELPEIDPDQTTITPAKRIPAILLEYAEHGSLADLHQKGLYKDIPFHERAGLCRDIAEGLAVLHKHGIVHGDIKLDNILVFDSNDSDGGGGSSMRAKLADFGFSVQASNERSRLKGRTWPWNDPEWNKPRTWDQLQKTDVFSYGLLAWTILTGKEIGILFELGGCDRSDPVVRNRAEGLKDYTLSWNAANSFRKCDTMIQLLVECLFRCSLEPKVDYRGTMDDIVGIWNTWFSQDLPYRSIPPGTELGPRLGLESANRVSFQRISAYMSDHPPSVKRELAELYLSSYLSADEKSESAIFRAFALMTGWGVDLDLNEAKRLIDETSARTPSMSIFQPMFFETSLSNFKAAIEGFCTSYERTVFQGLMLMVEHTTSYEAYRQLARYFPMPADGSYTRMRSILYRKNVYKIAKFGYPTVVTCARDSELVVWQLADIENNYLREEVLNRQHNRLHFAVFSGFAEAVDLTLESDDFNQSLLEQEDHDGYTPLLAAFSLGSFKIAELLIHAGADLRKRSAAGETILHFLNEFDNLEELAEISDLVLALGMKSLINTTCRYRTYPIEFLSAMVFLIGPPLNTAIMRGNTPLVKILLKHGADPCQGIIEGVSPLELAASGHFLETLTLFWEAFPYAPGWSDTRLLESAINGSKAHQRRYFHGPLMEKMMQGTLDFLIDQLVLVNSPLKILGEVPLIHYTVRCGDASMLSHIISRIGTVDINTYSDGATPLHLAIVVGSNESFNLLIEHGANPHLPYKHRTPISSLRLCCQQWNGTNQMVKYLVESGVGRDLSGNYPDILTDAIGICNFEAASILIAAGVKVDQITTTSAGWTTLGLVVRTCTYNSVAQMRFLIDHQVAIGNTAAGFIAIPSVWYTVLHIAAIVSITTPFYDRSTMSDVLDYLLDKFSDPGQLNARDKKGYTALHRAALSGNVQVVERLLSLDTVDTSIKSEHGMTAYQCALNRDLKEIPDKVRRLGERAVANFVKDRSDVISAFEKMGADRASSMNISVLVPILDFLDLDL